MIEAMDAAFGRLLGELDALGLADNTLVVFTSDNGGFGGVADNRPLRAAKGFLYEGERHNLAAEMPDEAASLNDLLAQWRKRVNAALPKPR